jgi:hypothetical protein
MTGIVQEQRDAGQLELPRIVVRGVPALEFKATLDLFLW